MEEQIESRLIEFEPEEPIVLETRANGKMALRGLAIAYNRLSVDLGGFRERVLPGAFDKILGRQRGRRDIVSYYNHNQDYFLGRESAGTLEIISEQRGISYLVELPDTSAGRDVRALVESGNLKGSSFSFSVAQRIGERFTTDDSGKAIREIVEASGLYEMGPVVNPAYPSTTAVMSMRAVAMRSFEAWLQQQQPEAIARRSLVEDAAVAMSLRLRNV
jgi:hypothetical protein